MKLSRLLTSLFGWGRRPVVAPTALSMSVASGLLVMALLLPDRGDDRAATAAELGSAPIMQGGGGRTVGLRDRLVAGLQARRTPEVDFVEHVVVLVHTGQLPQRIVDETFFWAREHALKTDDGRVRRPIIYFQPAMTARAKRLGVEL